jgi:hypothetical protein
MAIEIGLPPRIGEPIKPHTNHRHRFVPFLNPVSIDEAVDAVREGRIPSPSKGGYIEDRHGRLGAIDAVAAEIQGNVIRLLPELKRVVDSRSGLIRADSLVVKEDERAVVELWGVNFQPWNDQMLAQELGVPSSLWVPGVRLTAPLPRSLLGDFEFDDVSNGVVTIRPKVHYY